MATTVGALRVTLTLDSTQYVGALRQAEQQGSAFQSALGGIASMASGALKAASVAFTGLSTAAIGFGISASKTAMRTAEMDVALGQLAKTSGISKQAMDEQIAVMRKQGVTMSAAQNTVAQFARAQMDMSKSAELARVAQDLAIYTMQDSSQTLDDLLHGIQTGNTQLDVFRQLNIQAGQSVDQYAKSIGKSANELTAAERQQALLNEVLAKGTTIAGSYEAAMKQPGKVLRSFPRLFDDIRNSIGQAFLPALASVIVNSYEMVKAFSHAIDKGGALRPVIDSLGSVVSAAAGPFAKIAEHVTGWLKSLKPGQVDAFVKALGPMSGIIAGLAGALGGLGTTTIGGVLPVIGPLLAGINPLVAGLVVGLVALGAATPAVRDGIGEIVKALQPMAAVLGKALMDALKQLMPLFDQLIKALVPVIIAVVTIAATLVGKLLPVLLKVVEALAPFVVMIVRLVAAFVGGLLPVLVPVVDLIAQVASAFVDALSPAFKQVTDAMVPLIPPLQDLGKQLSETLGPVVVAMTPILAELAKMLGQQLAGAILLVIPLIGLIITGIRDFSSMLDTAGKMVAGWVATVIGWFTALYNALVGGSIIPDLVKAITWWFNTMLSGATIIVTTLVNVVTGLFNTLLSGITTIVTAIGTTVIWWFNYLSSTAQGIVSGLWQFVTTTWQQILADTTNLWTSISGTVISWATGMRDGAVAVVTGMLTSIQQAFTTAKNWIKDQIVAIANIWNELCDKLKSIPGLGDEAAKWKIDVTGLQAMATGGVVPARAVGGGFRTTGPTAVVGEGRQSYPEYVIPTDPAFSRRAAGLWLEAGARLRMLAAGGNLSAPWFEGSWPVTQSYGNPSAAYAGGLHTGIDIGYPRGTKVFAGTEGDAQHISGGGLGNAVKFLPHGAPGVAILLMHMLGYAGGQGAKKKGDLLSYGDSTGFSTGDHLHFEVQVNGRHTDPMEWLQAGAGPAGGAGAGGFGPFNAAIDWAKEQFGKLPPGFKEWAIYLVTKAAPEMMKKIATDAFRAVSSMVSGWTGSGTFQDWAKQAISATGVSDSWLRALDIAAKNESGYDPKAINLWDSNALKGTPSKGVMQVIDPTFQAYKHDDWSDIWNPVHNIAAAINYIKARYGDIYNLPGVKSVLSGGSWIGYDGGGVLRPGATLALNTTGRNEAVLNAPTFDRLLRVLDRLESVLTGPGAGGLTVNNHYEGEGVSSQEVVSDLLIALRTL